MIEIIPAIDLMDGEAVRLSEGDFSTRKVYFKDPLEAAQMYVDTGLKYLHLVDLDNAKVGKLKDLKVLEKICSSTDLHVDYGGGIKTRQDLLDIFNAGAKQVNCGSLARHEPDTFVQWIEEFGDAMILSADARDGRIMSEGWQDQSQLMLVDFIEYFTRHGLMYVTSTDIAKDGMLSGPSLEMYRDLRAKFPGLVICASGGVSSMEDISELERLEIDRVITGKAIYEGRISLGEIKNFVLNA